MPFIRLAAAAVPVLLAAALVAAPAAAEAPPAAGVSLADLARAAELDAAGLAAYREGRYAESARLLAERAELPAPGRVDALYNAACSLALAGDAEGALATLRRAAEAGLRNPGFVAADGDLAALHGDARWAGVLALVEANDTAYRAKVASPESSRLVTDDLARFWAAYDRAAAAESDEERAAIFARDYLEPGSAGLLDFYSSRIHSAQLLAAQAAAARPFFDRIRANTLRPLEQTEVIRQAFRRLEEIYPPAIFPDVYFLIGRFTSGGTTAASGLLIGVELYGLDPGTPPEKVPEGLRHMAKPVTQLPGIVAHELVHYQQSRAADDGSLLFAALYEGGADFVAELIHPGGEEKNYQAWGRAHAARVAQRFLAHLDTERDEGGHRDWFYNYATAGDDWFPDLGYYVGREIARGYYERADDKAAAVAALLRLEDPRAILAASGYAERFAPPPEEAASP